MKKKIINLEINEIYPKLLNDFLNNKKYKNSYLKKLHEDKVLHIYETKAIDIEKEKLYPSQTWASFNTGISYQKHNCYWYSDPLDSKELIWSKLVLRNKSVGIFGSIHSSKIPNNLFNNKLYKFYIPDCFSDENIVKPNQYLNFQKLNNNLVAKSGRITSIKSIFKNILKNFFHILIAPINFGLDAFSIKMIIKIIIFSIKTKNKEFLRMAQFPLMGSIYINLFKKYKPNYSTLYSNHIAGNLHRYMYAHYLNDYKNKNKYSKKWINRNKEAISLSIKLLDDLIGCLLNKKDFKNCTILITSSMGQEPSKDFDKKNLTKYDGKIVKMNLFLKELYKFQFDKYNLKLKYEIQRNMIPQYGFKLHKGIKYNKKYIAGTIEDFLSQIGLDNNVDVLDDSIVLSISPYDDVKLQENFDIKQATSYYSKYGIEFFKINDHHSGTHSPNGLLAVINPTKKLQVQINNNLDNDRRLNYLKFQKLIIDNV